MQHLLRQLPSIHQLLELTAVQKLLTKHGRHRITQLLQEAVSEQRAQILSGALKAYCEQDFMESLIIQLNHKEDTLVPVINATGVCIHTNLGRSPLAKEALATMQEVGSAYNNLEFDLQTGKRGKRHLHTKNLICELTGAEDAVVVNNCAAAVYLCLKSLAKNQEVIVSRGELVEIGGGFRIPDIMNESGALLKEVGTTNRTHLKDYQHAISENTALLLQVHRSNFEIKGFTTSCSTKELAQLSARNSSHNKIPLMVDAGSGLLQKLAACPEEIPMSNYIKDGADLITFSGDKLLGGPQAGIIAGKAKYVEAMRSHPLMRAFRCDKITLAGLFKTLQLWRDCKQKVPLFSMSHPNLQNIETRIQNIISSLNAPQLSSIISRARIGGGTTPETTFESRALQIITDSANKIQKELREHTPAIICRIENDNIILDFSTIFAEHDQHILKVLQKII